MAQAVNVGPLMADGVPFAKILDGDGRIGHGRGRGRCLSVAHITSAKVCSVFLKYQIPDATRTITSITAIKIPGR